MTLERKTARQWIDLAMSKCPADIDCKDTFAVGYLSAVIEVMQRRLGDNVVAALYAALSNDMELPEDLAQALRDKSDDN